LIRQRREDPITHCNALQHTTTHCSTRQRTAAHGLSLPGRNPLIGQRKQASLYIAVSLDEPSTGKWHVVLQCVAVCCGVLKCVALCCGVAECCSALQCVAVYRHSPHRCESQQPLYRLVARKCCSVLQYVAVSCSGLSYVVVFCRYYGVLPCLAMYRPSPHHHESRRALYKLVAR